MSAGLQILVMSLSSCFTAEFGSCRNQNIISTQSQSTGGIRSEMSETEDSDKCFLSQRCETVQFISAGSVRFHSTVYFHWVFLLVRFLILLLMVTLSVRTKGWEQELHSGCLWFSFVSSFKKILKIRTDDWVYRRNVSLIRIFILPRCLDLSASVYLIYNSLGVSGVSTRKFESKWKVFSFGFV